MPDDVAFLNNAVWYLLHRLKGKTKFNYFYLNIIYLPHIYASSYNTLVWNGTRNVVYVLI